MANKNKGFNVQNERKGTTIRKEKLTKEQKEEKKRAALIKKLKRRTKDVAKRGYDTEFFENLSDLSTRQLKSYWENRAKYYSKLQYIVPETGEYVTGTTGRHLEYQKAYYKGYYTRTGKIHEKVEPEYQPFYESVIDRFREWLYYDDYNEYRQGKRMFKSKRTKSVKEIESNLHYIGEVKEYINDLLNNLISSYGIGYVGNIINMNISALQVEMDLITFKGPSDAEVTRASSNTIIEILTQTRDINRAKEISELEDEYDFMEEV